MDLCRTILQINTSAASTGRSAKSNPRDALQTSWSSGSGVEKSFEMFRKVKIGLPQRCFIGFYKSRVALILTPCSNQESEGLHLSPQFKSLLEPLVPRTIGRVLTGPLTA